MKVDIRIMQESQVTLIPLIVFDWTCKLEIRSKLYNLHREGCIKETIIILLALGKH